MQLEPIAIAGIGCRFPGANNPQEFWELLCSGKDAITEIPASRWDSSKYYHLDGQQQGKTNVCRGGFLDDITKFDPQFFGIAPREAKTIDPQQRLLLEVAWEALEDAGAIPEELRGSNTGVYIGIGTHDYSILMWQKPVNEPYATTGTGNCIAANRISYAFDFKGASLAVDTACSSSLVAVHLACQSIWNQESDMALAGGVNVLLIPTILVGFAKGGFLSPDGKCKSFDATANGYVRSEGAGIVLLKPLSKAQADGDRIYGIIRGTAVNQDGFSNGIAAPNPDAQEAVIKEAYQRAGVDPAQVQYIEAHGTGTKLGDLIEIESLGRVLSKNRTSENYCAISSVKTNIGHTETAAGIAGLIKAALSLHYGKIPPSLHFNQPNPAIDFNNLALQVNTKLTSYRDNFDDVFIGVNSFGFGGTNAHVVLQQQSSRRGEWHSPLSDNFSSSLNLFTISGKNETALQDLAQKYIDFLDSNTNIKLQDICFTTNTKRTHFNHRLAIITESKNSLRNELNNFINNKEAFNLVSEEVKDNNKIAFLFTGQGSQYLNMGKELYETNTIFKNHLNLCAENLQNYLDIPLLDVIYGKDSELINQTQYTQPAIFSIGYSLAKLWIAWGIKPDVLTGHSIGEYIAASIAGVFSLEDALKLVSARGKLMQNLPQNGSMVSVLATETIVEEVIKDYSETVSIAAINGNNSIVISGATESINKVVNVLNKNSIKTKQLTVSHAFHSPLMQPILKDFKEVVETITYNFPQIDLVSTVTGDYITDDITKAQYWVDHIIKPVRFLDSIKTLYKSDCNIYLECGAKPILSGIAMQIDPPQPPLLRGECDSAGGSFLPSLRTQHCDRQQVLQTLGTLYTKGIKIDWRSVYQQNNYQVVSLPTYPFQRQRLWYEGIKLPTDKNFASVSGSKQQQDYIHPLLQNKVCIATTGDIVFESNINIDNPVYLKDHQVGEKIVFPATGYLEMALAAADNILSDFIVEDFEIVQPLLIEDSVTTQLVLDSNYQFQIFSLVTGENKFTLHATGKIAAVANSNSNQYNLGNLKGKFTTAVDVAQHYSKLARQGLHYGNYFQGIAELSTSDTQVLGKIKLPDGLSRDKHQLHPVILDSCFQLIGAIVDKSEGVYLPTGLEKLTVYNSPGDYIYCLVEVENSNSKKQLSVNFKLLNETGLLIGEIDNLVLNYVNSASWEKLFQKETVTDDCLYQIVWQEKPSVLDIDNKNNNWLVFGDVENKLRDALENSRDKECLFSTPDKGKDIIQDAIKQFNSNHFGIVYLANTETTEDIPTAEITTCQNVVSLIQSLVNNKSCSISKLLLVTQSNTTESVNGLGRVINNEHPNLNCTLVDVDNISSLVAELYNCDNERQIKYHQGKRYVARLDKYQPSDNKPFQLQISDYGMLDKLHLASLERKAPKRGEVEIQIVAGGINFRDVLNALGMLQEYLTQMGFSDATNVPFGGECAGIVVAVGENVTEFSVGDEVIAAQAIGSLASHVTVDANFVISKPPHISFTEAATIPTTFLTAYYGLCKLAAMKPGDKVLIHSAAGGVGQAAVQLAKLVGAEIYATASESKWDFLKSLGIKHIFNSRSLDFAEEIKELTPGEGIDIVLNSLNGEYISKNLEVIKTGGRFVEIGKIGIWDKQQIQAVRGDVSYYPFDLLEVSQDNPSIIKQMLEELMQNFIAIPERNTSNQLSIISEGVSFRTDSKQNNILKPLPYKEFSFTEAEAAFRYMAGAKHIGKVVLSQNISLPVEKIINSEGSYLITGGLGALGLQVAKWLVSRGAKQLLLIGRSQPSIETRETIKQLEATGTTIKVIQGDISDYDSVTEIVSSQNLTTSSAFCDGGMPLASGGMPFPPTATYPLTGIIHCAGVLDDCLLKQLSPHSLEKVMSPKVRGAWNLHMATKDIPLDFFVCFSSITSILGTIGQGNYAAANSFMDGLIQQRRALGLPGLSINWGLWETGMIGSLDAEVRKRIAKEGVEILKCDRAIRILETLLTQQINQVSVFPVNWQQFLQDKPHNTLYERFKPKTETVAIPRSKFLQHLATIPENEQADMFTEHIKTQVAKVLGFADTEYIDIEENFGDLGMDSLMAVELKSQLQTSLNTDIPLSLTFDYPTVESLASYLFSVNSNQLSVNSNQLSVNSNQLSVNSEQLSVNSKQLSVNNQPSTINNEQLTINHQPSTINDEQLTIKPEHYQFKLLKEYTNIKQDLNRLDAMGNPFFTVHEGIAKDTTVINGKELTNYSHYNYIGMSGDPIVTKAAQDAIIQYGTSVSASRVVSGEKPIHRELETAIANFIGTEDCIVYIGGHATNVTTIGHLFGEKDLIICDSLSHNSIQEGCRLSGATKIEFPHNDYQELETILQQYRYQYEKVLIAIEGIYSTDGDIAPLPEIISLKKQYKTFLLVDEAHSIGVLGATGRGIGEYYNVNRDDVDLWMGTLSKSFASCGGYIAGCKELIEYLKYTAPGFVFSVGMSPSNTAAALSALKLLQKQPERVVRLQARSKFFLELAKLKGLNTGNSHSSPIVPIIIGEPQKAVKRSQQLFTKGINVQPMIYPSVPYDAARLRFFMTSLHTEEQIEFTLNALMEVMEE